MKNTTFTERLNLAMKMRGFTQAELGEAVGMAQPSVWKLTSGKAQSSRKSVEIAKALQVDPVWLTTGDGVLPDFITSDDEKPRDGVLISEIKPREIEAWGNHTPLDSDEVEIPYYKSIELAAGSGCNGGSDNNGFKLRFSRATLNRYNVQPSDAMSFPVHGDSMSPVIPNGTTVSVSKGHKKVVDGGIYAIQQDDLLRVKILHRQPGGKLIIRSFNSDDYPDEIADESTVKIIGRVFNWSVMGW
ncbi:XRE family transcriptional regulator [Providencia rustigianii]|uniref:XRE family transcriptional regulator n=1 Tax=Providencia rustigianii TaxID=158850 RepID=UPI002240175C|nr:helix-turn-helix transcriptional regulator [Providencia rustigianii]